MKYLYILLSCLSLSFLAAAQKKGSVKAQAFDTLAKRGIPDATITVLQKKDSSLVSFGMTDDNGRVTLTDLPDGEYRLLMTHVAYHNSSFFFTISPENRHPDMGQLIMNDKSKVLEEVVVQSEAPPVTLVGDTVQYNAGSFKTQPNASVEQLLKKLPGVEVNKDGSIKAQGQTVKRVLVDGKEFFGNDPKMATKNLPADAVDKVQVYDKSSDQAQLTGFDDGNSEKTINLKLKADKKKGAFGKIMGGAGTDERLEGRFNVNSFKGARQMSVIGMGNNTNTEGFSAMDMMNFTGELGRMMRGGNVNINLSSGDPLLGMLSGQNQGIRTIWGGGLNYNNIIGTKTELTSNYFYNHFNPNTETSLRRQYLLPDSTYFYDNNSRNDVATNSHRLNLGFDYIIDSFHSIKWNPSIGYQQSKSYGESEYVQTGEDGRISNQGYNNTFNDSRGYNVRNDLLLRKKFRKRGRTISLSLQTTLNGSDADGTQESINERYVAGMTVPQRDTINLQSTSTGDLKGYNARLVYTEPMFKNSLLELSVSKSNSRSRSEKTTYDYNNSSGKFDELNELLTNDFTNTYGITNGGVRLRTQKRKYNYFAGLTWQQADLEGKIVSGIKDSIISKRFFNLLPSARFQYNFTRYKNVVLNYQSYTNQPTVSQLQPIPDISNRLNIREGNPDLKQEFTHSLQLSYSGLNPFRNKNLFAFFTMTRTDNKIVNYDTLFANGVKSTRPVNVDGVYNLNGNINVSVPLAFMKSTLRAGSNLMYNKGQQFINGEANTINTTSAGPRITLDINPNDKIDWMLSAGINYNYTRYSLQPRFNTTYFSQMYETEFNWEMPGGFYFSTDFVYTVNNQLADGFNAKIPLWGASISKQFLKNKKGELKLRVNDILNRNEGITRTSNQNFIEDKRVNTLRRYGILTFTYSLSKTGLGGSTNGVRIITR